MSDDPVVIVAAGRTPLGRFQGALAGQSAHDLGGVALEGVLKRAGLNPDQVDEVMMGCVLPAGQGQAPARQAARKAGLPDKTHAATLNKVCGSGMKAVMLAHDMIKAKSADIVLAGGMESMSNAPFLLKKARAGYRIGHDIVYDHLMLDGLEDAYEGGRPMGDFGEATAGKYGFSREDQDQYAIESVTRAQRAIEAGVFNDEVLPINDVLAEDEIPGRLKAEKIPNLRPAFRQNGTITAASSSANADGAAALALTRLSVAQKQDLSVEAIIRGHVTHSQEPEWFTTAPVPAIEKLLEKTGWSGSDVDLYEVNEAFAAVAMVAARDLNIPAERLNMNGGACALGHPIGATGARILVTLLYALKRNGLQRGIASLCIGGGEATAVAIERP